MWSSIKSILSFTSSSSSAPTSGQAVPVGGRQVEVSPTRPMVTDNQISDCIRDKDVDTMLELIDNGVDLHTNPLRFLGFAFESDSIPLLKKLIDKGINLNSSPDFILLKADRCFTENTIDMLTICIDAGMDLKAISAPIRNSQHQALKTFLEAKMTEVPSDSVIDSSTNQQPNILVQPAPYDPESGIPPTFDADIEDLDDNQK